MAAVKHEKNNKLLINLLLIAIVIALAAVPFFITKNAEFGGTDAQVAEAIGEIKAGYKPWFNPLFIPASGEIESLLFAVQAAIGAGVIGYCLGYMKGKSKK